MAQLSLLALWTLYLLRQYLNFDPLMIPQGREYFIFIQNHFMWERARECGPCAMWNGSFRGGFPAFVDVHNAMLYPPVIVATFIWGALNGAKAALIFTFFLAGFAQWWLGRVLGLGRVACVWSGAMAIAAGGLAGRMNNGGVSIIISAVCFALLLPPAIQLSRDGRRKTAAVLGLVIALALVSGHGYYQLAFPMLAPLFLIFILGNPLGVKLLFRRYLLATGIGVLVAAPFLVPLFHFYPSFEKRKYADFDATQSFQYVPLNFVINDINVYISRALGTEPYPYFYVNYIGWIAVIFAVIGCYSLWRRHQTRLAAFLLSWTVGALWLSSAMPLRWVRDMNSPGNPLYEFMNGLRHPAQIAGLAVPTILALAAIGVDSLLKRRPNGMRLGLSVGSAAAKNRMPRLDLRWLLVAPLVFALSDLQGFSKQFLTLRLQPIAEMEPVLDALSTTDLQWVGTPYGEEFWVGQALERNLKLSIIVLAWHWNDRPTPPMVLEAVRPDKDPQNGMAQVSTVAGLPIYAAPPGNEYAAVLHADGTRTVCSAHGASGNIDVTCDLSQPGRLEIKENYYSGWKATAFGDALDVTESSGSSFTVNGDSIIVSDASGRITVDLPAGKSTAELRYRPWDVPLGIALMFVGLVVAGYCLVRREPQRARAEARNVIDMVQPVPSGKNATAD